MEDKTRVYNMDCMEALRETPDKFYDLAIVDPPYGINIGRHKTLGKRGKTYSTTKYKKSNWDTAIPDKEYFDQLFRVSKNQIIFGANYFTHFLPPSQGWFVYDKRMPENFTMAHAELAFTSFDRAIRMKFVKRSDMQNTVSNNKEQAMANAKIHQCQKPVSLYDYILFTYAKPGDKLLDTHAGSQSSRISAYKGGFDMTLYEIDTDYFNDGCQRFERFKTQKIIDFN